MDLKSHSANNVKDSISQSISSRTSTDHQQRNKQVVPQMRLLLLILTTSHHIILFPPYLSEESEMTIHVCTRPQCSHHGSSCLENYVAFPFDSPVGHLLPDAPSSNVDSCKLQSNDSDIQSSPYIQETSHFNINLLLRKLEHSVDQISLLALIIQLFTQVTNQKTKYQQKKYCAKLKDTQIIKINPRNTPIFFTNLLYSHTHKHFILLRSNNEILPEVLLEGLLNDTSIVVISALSALLKHVQGLRILHTQK